MDNPFLSLASDFFSRININNRIIGYGQPLDDRFDLGLRNMLYDRVSESVSQFKGMDPGFFTKNFIYFTVDKYDCHYMLFPVPGTAEKEIFFAGPYLTVPPSTAGIQEMISRLSIPQMFFTALSQYYSTLPVVSQDTVLEPFAASIGDALYGAGKFSLRYLAQRKEEGTNYSSAASVEVTNNTIRELEKRYEIEEQMMDCISRGDIDGALHLSGDRVFAALDSRAASALRSRKNYMIILGTLCRKAAQRGGVHPVYLDELSRRMAQRIESITSPGEDREVAREMVRKYCMLVRSNSTGNYSPVISDVVNFITQHLSEPELSLSVIAEELKLNKTYLSALFSREVGMTLISFIASRRIEQAIFLLNTQNLQIQAVAAACGIPDLTYFTRLFRKEKGITPSQYKKMIRG